MPPEIELSNDDGTVRVDGRDVGAVRRTPRGWRALLGAARTPAGPTYFPTVREALAVVLRNAGVELEDPRGERDLNAAVRELSACIRRHLETVPPDGTPVRGLSEAKVSNLARTIAACLDEFGRGDVPIGGCGPQIKKL